MNDVDLYKARMSVEISGKRENTVFLNSMVRGKVVTSRRGGARVLMSLCLESAEAFSNWVTAGCCVTIMGRVSL